jgi:hypothetical protein
MATLNDFLGLEQSATWQERAQALQGRNLRVLAHSTHLAGLYASPESAYDVLSRLSSTMEPREIDWDVKQHMLAAKWEGRTVGWAHTHGECNAILDGYRDFLSEEYGEITSEEGLFIARVNQVIACKGTSRAAAHEGLFSYWRAVA